MKGKINKDLGIKKLAGNFSLWLYCALIVVLILLGVSLIVSVAIFLLIHFRIIEVESGNYSATLPFLAILAGGIIVGMVITLMIGSKLIKPIKHINQGLSEVAKGNFTVRIEEHSKFEAIEMMFENFNLMVSELSSIETLRNDFVVSVSHEFKTPLAAIEGYVALLQDPTLDEKKHEECVEMIIGNVRRLSTMTGNILQLSKLENQGIVAAKDSFNLDETIRQSILLLENQWSDKQIEFELELPSTPYYGSEDMLSQVFYNLIQNAIKFSSQKGLIEITLKGEGNMAMIEVIDHGKGMDEETKKHAFDKFYRGKNVSKEEGNGLGLSLVYRIVTLLGGKIEVESQLGQGTAFTLSLPLDSQNNKKADASA